MQRLTFFEWVESKVGPQQVVTPAEGETVKALTPLEHVRHCLLYDDAKSASDDRPTLVYFHWPHDHAAHGEVITDTCTKTLDDETTCRWGMLFRCVQIDMSMSDKRLVELLGTDGKPGFLVLDAETKVVARIAAGLSTTKLQKALEAAIQKFPERWKRIQKDVDDQAKRVASAKRLAKDDRFAEALSEVEAITMSKVRIGPAFDEAAFLVFDLQQRVAREREKERAK